MKENATINTFSIYTFLKQSKLFLYIISPTKDVERWFWSLVLTRSMGYTAVAPVADERKGNIHIVNSEYRGAESKA